MKLFLKTNTPAWKTQLLTPMNAILLNQACADFGIAFFGNPVAFYNALHGEWMLGASYCVIYGFLMSLFGICSIFTLTVLAYQRYNVICHPFSKSQLSWTEANIYIASTWVCSFLVSTPPLFGWGSYKQEAANISCSINWHSREWNATSYILVLFLFGLIVPVFVITYSYYNILKTVRFADIMKNRTTIGNVEKVETGRLNVGRVKKAENHVARMVFIMIIAFFVAWGPYAIFSLIIAFSDINLSAVLTIAPSLFAKSSVCYNPVIYFFLNSQFRKSWLNRIRFCRPQEETSNEVKHMSMQMFHPKGKYPIPINGQGAVTADSSIFSNSYSNESMKNSVNRKRELKISQLMPYKTMPLMRRKLDFKTRSLSNLIF